jgi:hypothetical protein
MSFRMSFFKPKSPEDLIFHSFMPPPIIPFPRQAIAAGIVDGRFVTSRIEQEATFWRPRLWQEAGGVDPNFRLAGDFDLWRRFARHTDLVVVDRILGCFRKRAGQLSEDMDRHRAEIDASLYLTVLDYPNIQGKDKLLWFYPFLPTLLSQESFAACAERVERLHCLESATGSRIGPN